MNKLKSKYQSTVLDPNDFVLDFNLDLDGIKVKDFTIPFVKSNPVKSTPVKSNPVKSNPVKSDIVKDSVKYVVTGGVKPSSNNYIDVAGKVVDLDGTPLAGANVSFSHPHIRISGTATNNNGEYSISVPRGSEVTFSFVGMKSKTLIAEKIPPLLKMVEENNKLDEVVITATKDKVIQPKKENYTPLYVAGGVVLALVAFSFFSSPDAKKVSL